MFRRLASLFALATVLAAPAVAQPFPATVHLKLGQTITVSVHEVTPWGFRFDEKRAMLFRVIDTVTTPSDSLVGLILAQLPDARTEASGSETRIVLSDVLIVAPVRSEREPTIRRFRVQGGPTVGARYSLEASMRAEPRLLDALPLVVQVTTQIGTTRLESEVRDRQTNAVGVETSFPTLIGISAGLGVTGRVGRSDITALFEAWNRFALDSRLVPGKRDPNDVFGGPNATSLSLMVALPLPRWRSHIVIGGRNFLAYPNFEFSTKEETSSTSPYEFLLQLRFDLLGER